jgi:hypothetical protein
MAGNDSLDLHHQIAAVNAELGAAKIKAADEEHQRKVAADRAREAKPLPGYRMDDQGHVEYGTQSYNPDTGAYDFTPGSGVGRPPVATGELAVLQRLMAEPNGPKSLDEAMRLRTAARQSPQAAQRFDLAIDAEARHQAALEQQAFAADPTNIGKTFNVQAAEERRRQDLRNRLYGVPDGAPQSGTPPAPDNPSAKPQAANPTVAPADPLQQARAAIAQGAPREQVIERLKKMGVDTTGL